MTESLNQPVPGAPPMTPRQRLIWVEERLSHGLPLNSVVTLLEVRGELDMPVLARAFDRLVQRHDAMRLCLPGKKGNVLRWLPDGRACRLAIVNLADRPDPLAAYDHWMAARVSRPWQPNHPLVDAAIVRRGPGDYIFFVNRHHIITDNGASTVMHEELEALYAECLHEDGRGPASEALAPAPSFADYLTAEADVPVAAESAAFWAERQRSRTPTLRFYGGPAAVTSVQSRRVNLTLDTELSGAIDRLGPPLAVQFYLLATVFAYLGRVTGERDLVIGAPFHNRTAATRRLVGLLMDICPNRIALEAGDTGLDVVRKVKEESELVRPHRRHTLSSHQAGWEVLFNFLPNVPASFAGHDAHYVHTSPLALRDGFDAAAGVDSAVRTRDKLAVTVLRGRGAPCYEVQLDFNGSLLPAGMPIERTGAHFLAVLRSIVQEPDVPIDAIDILASDERVRLLGQAGAIEAPAAQRTVVELFRERASATPNRDAVISPAARLTYGDLHRQVRTLTAVLQAAGVRPGTVVGVCVDRTPRMVVALLAVLSAGGAYVPIDPSNPAERIESILDDVEPSLLITERIFRDHLDARRLTGAIWLDTLALDADSPGDDAPGPAPDHNAYIIHTSGSTGRPKGVIITHGQLASFLAAMGPRIGMAETDRVLAATTIAFDPTMVEVFLPLVIGACVVVIPRAVAIDGRALGRAIDEHGITIMQSTPATFRMLLAAGWQGQSGLTVLCGAEVMSPSLAESLLSRVSALWNLYGPTETTVWATTKRVTSPVGQTVTVGTPLEGSHVYLVNAALTPVPIGVSGEIVIGGPRVANGYHQRPQLTAERFVPDPFSPQHSGRMYRTGDYARLREDLEIEFLGRVDNQVKVRGNRVELEEIEAVIGRYPGVSASCITTFEDGSGEVALSAHLEGAGVDVQELLSFLRRHLAKHMVPSRVLIVDRLPRTQNGKVDRAAVARIEQVQPVVVRTGEPPASDLEFEMLMIWREHLQAPHLGVTDDFFEAGGHSLLIIGLLQKIERNFSIELDLERIFLAPTVRLLCTALGHTVVPKPALTQPMLPSACPGTVYFIHGKTQYEALAELLKDMVASASVIPNGTRWLRRLVGDGEPIGAIQRVTEAYADSILRTHKGGPISVAGHSFGGTLAIETACALEARGVPVRCVFLFDTELKEYPSQTTALDARAEEGLTEWEPVIGAFRTAGVRAYREVTRPLSSSVVLLRASDKDAGKKMADVDLTQGWGRCLGPGQLSIAHVPGDHQTVIKPEYAPVLAREMRPHLD